MPQIQNFIFKIKYNVLKKILLNSVYYVSKVPKTAKRLNIFQNFNFSIKNL